MGNSFINPAFSWVTGHAVLTVTSIVILSLWAARVCSRRSKLRCPHCGSIL